jgi:SecD/SecF fusion protein
MLKGAGILEFRILPTEGHPEVDSDRMNRYEETLKVKGPRYASDSRYVWCEIENVAEWTRPADDQQRPAIEAKFGEKSYVLASNQKDEALLHSADAQKGWKLQKARPTQDTMGRRAIGFTLDERGGKLFSRVTGRNINRPLCILLDGMAISAPKIESRIRREGVITGSFTQTEQADLIGKLNAGSLPARLIEQPISVRTIGPSIGADNRDQGIRAGLIGLVVVIACMAAYYLLAGLIADLALLMNLLFVLAIMALVRATFTLPGIAGIILTIGMSVDANVLIFERIREEQQKGSSLRIAIRNGYQRAFRTIFDANLTTFITAAILFWVASEEVKGFAIVLMLGICSSMFSALFAKFHLCLLRPVCSCSSPEMTQRTTSTILNLPAEPVLKQVLKSLWNGKR